MVTDVTLPTGDLSDDPPNYPGSDWRILGFDKNNKQIQLYLAISVDNRTRKKQQGIVIGKPLKGEEEESDEQIFRRGWNIFNYIKSIENWNMLTKDEIYLRLMAAGDERYYLKGKLAQTYGPNGYIALRAEGERLHRATLSAEAAVQLDAQRRNRGPSIEEHIRAVVNVPPQHQQQLLEQAGNIREDSNSFTRLHRFFSSVFNMSALKRELLNRDGTAESYEEIAKRMLPSLGGPTAGVDIQQEFNIYPLPNGCNLDEHVFFWKNGMSRTKHFETIKFQNIKSLMFYNAMACFKGVPWNQKNVRELILDILGNTDNKIWYITDDGFEGYEANEMGSYDMIEIPRGRILAECSGNTSATSRGVFRTFVTNM